MRCDSNGIRCRRKTVCNLFISSVPFVTRRRIRLHHFLTSYHHHLWWPLHISTLPPLPLPSAITFCVSTLLLRRTRWAPRQAALHGDGAQPPPLPQPTFTSTSRARLRSLCAIGRSSHLLNSPLFPLSSLHSHPSSICSTKVWKKAPPSRPPYSPCLDRLPASIQ